ncbi:hypothetical protein [Novosphingobium pentaromativorans]|nr:hypothetical protein [Novosphingobium pentaromativorans]
MVAGADLPSVPVLPGPFRVRRGTIDIVAARERQDRIGRALVQHGIERRIERRIERGLEKVRVRRLAREQRQHFIEASGLLAYVVPLGQPVQPREVGQQQAGIVAPPPPDQLSAKPHRLVHPVDRAGRQHFLGMGAREEQCGGPALRKDRIAPPQEIGGRPAHPHLRTGRAHIAPVGKVVEEGNLARIAPAIVGQNAPLPLGGGVRGGHSFPLPAAPGLPEGRGRQQRGRPGAAIPVEMLRASGAGPIVGRQADIARSRYPPPPEARGRRSVACPCRRGTG